MCQNIRISRCKLLKGNEYRGYTASKKTYFFGIKIHVVTASDGSIIEFETTPGSASDLTGLALLPLDLPCGAELFLDKAYNDYAAEDIAREAAGIELRPVRKSNSHKPDNTYEENKRRQDERRPVETHLSVLKKLFPSKLHATSAKGFMLKVMGIIVAYNLNLFIANV